jgi:UDP-N-acetylmuramyl pentapeptide phosphotransferase/UDP-N-acetylglucosamine-1-phosphate transferase
MLSANIDFFITTKFILLIIFFFVFNQICLNNQIFLSNANISKHKSFIKNKKLVPISAGFFLLFSNIILQKNFFYDFYNYFYLSIFLIGIYADFSKYFKPTLRIILQILVIGLFLNVCDIHVKDVRISTFNFFLNKHYFALIFAVFCILVFVNGANLIDGVNLSAIGYFLLIFITIYILSINNNFYLDREFVNIQIFLLIVILLFNFFNKSYLGDSGIYLMSLITSVVVINFINANSSISPYFAVLLLWYPCFENLFSIIRRLLNKSSTTEPDNKHLHHYIYSFLNKKKIYYSNNLAGLIILFFNTIILYFGYKFYNDTQSLILFIFLAIFLYLLFYFILRKKLKFDFKYFF